MILTNYSTAQSAALIVFICSLCTLMWVIEKRDHILCILLKMLVSVEDVWFLAVISNRLPLSLCAELLVLYHPVVWSYFVEFSDCFHLCCVATCYKRTVPHINCSLVPRLMFKGFRRLEDVITEQCQSVLIALIEFRFLHLLCQDLSYLKWVVIIISLLLYHLLVCYLKL